jgi:hypothetical protein
LNIFESSYLKFYILLLAIAGLVTFSKKILYSDLTSFSKNMIDAKPFYLISLVLILCPAIIMSLQTSWWDRASISNTYLGVMVTEFGTALLIALVVNKIIFNKTFQIRVSD